MVANMHTTYIRSYVHITYVAKSFCIVDGGWNDWVVGPCSKTCGGGMWNITRECNKPKPSCNGKDCDGLNYRVYLIKCNNFCCPRKFMTIIIMANS